MELAEEIARLREKNRELNRRCQSADAAAADAKRCLDALAAGTEKGTPWCSGSMGRALLAWHVSKQDELLRDIAERIRTLAANAEAVSFTVIEPGQPRRHGTQTKVQLMDLARLEGAVTMIDELLAKTTS